MLAPLDIAIIVLFLVVSLAISIGLRGRASGNLTDFFLGGRNLPWYIAGISMVATTFAADTPLWVAEKVHQHGVSGNWLWWNMLIGGMLTTFFFAKLWRRANVVTELEFIELRYSGPAAKFLRGFKAVYMGLFLNAVIIGWVNAAMMKILVVFFAVDHTTALWLIAGLMLLVAIYSSISGLLGVAFTDAIQFTLALTGCIILAIVVVQTEEVGGLSGLKEQLPAWRFDFFPSVGDSGGDNGILSITVGAFISFLAVQWWASWYPGNEPGGGGYISQRMMSAKDEKQALWATLFFQIAHYALRPWPWIIVGLSCLLLYPDLPEAQAGEGFVMAMRDHLPVGLKGMLLAAFLGAYMSTISTQLNWGASYLTNDLYRRFIKPDSSYRSAEDANRDQVQKARLFTLFIMLFGFMVTTQITMIDEAARFLINSGAGLGAVLILRWYWWRISAWSELSATIAPLIWFAISSYQIAPMFNTADGNLYLANEGNLIFTAVLTTITWLIVTFANEPTDTNTLEAFYQRVKPQGFWQPVANTLNLSVDNSGFSRLVVGWISGVAMTYGVLFFIGKLLFLEYASAGMWIGITLVSFFFLRWSLQESDK